MKGTHFSAGLTGNLFLPVSKAGFKLVILRLPISCSTNRPIEVPQFYPPYIFTFVFYTGLSCSNTHYDGAYLSIQHYSLHNSWSSPLVIFTAWADAYRLGIRQFIQHHMWHFQVDKQTEGPYGNVNLCKFYIFKQNKTQQNSVLIRPLDVIQNTFLNAARHFLHIELYCATIYTLQAKTSATWKR